LDERLTQLVISVMVLILSTIALLMGKIDTEKWMYIITIVLSYWLGYSSGISSPRLHTKSVKDNGRRVALIVALLLLSMMFISILRGFYILALVLMLLLILAIITIIMPSLMYKYDRVVMVES